MTYSDELREDTDLIDRFFPLNVFHNRPGTQNVLQLHWHDNIEIIYMCEGHAIFNIGTRSIEALPGDILFVNSGLLHSGYSVDNTSVDYYAAVLDKSLLGSQSPDPYHRKYIYPFLDGRLMFPDKIDKSLPHYGSIKRLVDSILEEFENKLPGFELSIKAHLHLLVLTVIRNYSFSFISSEDKEKYTRDVERFKELFTYVENHYFERITIEEAAKIVSLSPHHFCKTFKKITGSTFIEFVNLYRVNSAEELLIKTTLPVTEISDKVGFCNINYFDRMFKKYKRYSPSRARKK